MRKPGWGIIVEGDPLDLADWADGLMPPFDPWVEKYEGRTVLRSATLDELTSGDAVYNRALALIDRLNGAFAVSQQTRPLTFSGTIIQFTPNGKENRIISAGTGVYESRGRARAYSASIGPDGKPLPAPPSQVQRWVGIAQGDEYLNDALQYFAKGANWFDIYKALECLFKRAGGEHIFLDLGGGSENQKLTVLNKRPIGQRGMQDFRLQVNRCR